VARIYGGILGLLAFQTTLVRGWLHHNDLQSTLWAAWLSLCLFAVVGLVIGQIASQAVADSVADHMSAELAAQEKNQKNKKK
jgi:hypothetical protein